MGTSQSKPPAGLGKPLVPSWADSDPVVDGVSQPNSPAKSPQEVFEPRRLSGFRRSLRSFMRSGDQGDAKKALGNFSRNSTNSGSSSGQRVSRSARVGGSVIAALSSAASGNTIANNGFNLDDLNGQPVSQAINVIVDAFCPPGIIDEDVLRAAMGEALANALDTMAAFDTASIDDETVSIALSTFVAELVFNTIMAEQGQSAEDITPLEAIAREKDIRDLIREVTNVQATPIIQAQSINMTPNKVSLIVKKITTNVFKEMAGW